ncbi:MAG: RNA methyltransferase [Candidatus Thermoplasmatota archaeon]|nr:RNA methyltransferase [Candidatus Thermoplasmatota archaeon]
MARFSVVLVEPQTSGNIGAVARLIGNFSFEKLYLVNPVDLDDEAEKRAMHAKDVLENAEIVDDYEATVSNFDLVVGTSGINTEKKKKFLRKAETPEELNKSIADQEGSIALVFGREDQGLLNEELKKCDRLVRIPASEDYPILNLSHAVCVILYELFKEKEDEVVKREEDLSEKSERERLIETFSEVLKAAGYPEHKHEKTEVMFRKILGRSTLTRWEYHRLMGVFSQILRELEG